MSSPVHRPAHLPRLAARFDLTDPEVAEQAEKAAASVQRLADAWRFTSAPDGFVMQRLRAIAKRHAVRLPNKAGLTERINRMCDAGWWRRALRYRFKAVELLQIQAGAVHAKASPYVSAKALRRHERQAARLAEQMAALEAVNQSTGEVIAMADLIQASLSNPTHRRNALMARIKGIEASATAKGHIGLFLTITCPSRMHARHSKSGAPNETYDGTFPTRAHGYLRRVWSNALREAAHQGLTPYGLRVVEPHHDACPHWHILAFIAADAADDLAAIVRRHALRDSPDEAGAQLRRFTVERIDPAKGSAVGYVAKYVSKSIDGEGVESDTEAEQSGQSAARRQVAWARTWGIRQFQFFGVPPITPTRELYRVTAEHLPGQALAELHKACKANDYAAWLATVEAHGLQLRVEYSERPSTRYAGEISKAIQGLRIEGGDVGGALQLTTRCDSWVIAPKASAAVARAQASSAAPALEPPWTRFNNSAPIDFKELFPDALPEEVDAFGGNEEGEKCPAPGTATRCRTRPLEISRGAA